MRGFKVITSDRHWVYTSMPTIRLNFDDHWPKVTSTMGKLAGACIDFNKYGSAFSGGFNALITNIKTLRAGTSHHHCPDCKVSLVFSPRTASRVSYSDSCPRHFPRRSVSGACTMVSGMFSPIATSANRQAAFCNVCGERFAVWSRKGCADHTYAMGFILEFKGARDSWPTAKVQQLISEESRPNWMRRS
jgi:hypothetical protein